MPVPSSGELRLRADINQEVNGNNTDTNVSLGTLSNDVGFTEPDNMSDFYGYTACVAPSVTTNTSTSVGSGSFVAQGNVTSLGGSGCTLTDHGFYIGTSTNATSNTKHSLGAKSSTGTFSFTKTGLSSSTTYRVFAYATNSVGTTIGNMITTTTTLPQISLYLAGNWTAAPINNISGGCSTTGAGIWSFNGDCTVPYGNCGDCTTGGGVIGYGTITGSGCQTQINYGTYVAHPTYEFTQNLLTYTGTGRLNFTTRYSQNNVTYVRCTTCNPGWYRYLTKSGYQNRNLGTAGLTWTS